MSTATLATIGTPRMMTTWIKIGCGILVVSTGWWGLSSFDYERYLSPNALA